MARSSNALAGRTSVAEAGRLAEKLRASVGFDRGEPLDPELVVDRLGWRLDVAELSADVNGQDALLLPADRPHRFTVVVDPRLAAREAWMIVGTEPAESAAVADATQRFRVGHELGHSSFFDGGQPPRRCVPHTPAEERFCNAFSRFLLLPAAVSLPTRPSMLVDIARQRGLSLEIVASALTDRTTDVAILGGRLANGRALVGFATGVPPMPPEASFAWCTGTDSLTSPLDQGLYWPCDHPPVAETEMWTDGHRFLTTARLGRAAIASAA